MANKLIKILDVEFDENLTPKQVNIGTATQTSDMVFKIHVIVPNIIDLQNDSCYLALDIPINSKSGKVAKIKLPNNLNSSFEFKNTIDGIDYYESYINLDSRALSYAGNLKINLVIEHLTGEFFEYEDTQLEKVDTRSSETFSLTVTRSSNYETVLYKDDDLYDDAVDNINAILNSMSAYQTYAPAKKDTLQVLNSMPNDISNLNGLYYFKDKNEVAFIRDGSMDGVVFEDNILECKSKNDFPMQGDFGKLYIDQTANKMYRWSGSAYVEIASYDTQITALDETKINKYYTWLNNKNTSMSYKFTIDNNYLNFKTNNATRIQYNVLKDTLYYKNINRITYQIPDSETAYWETRIVNSDEKILTAIKMNNEDVSLYARNQITIGGADDTIVSMLNFRNICDMYICADDIISMRGSSYCFKVGNTFYVDVQDTLELRIGDSNFDADSMNANTIAKIGMYTDGTGEYEGSTIQIGGTSKNGGTYLDNLVFDRIQTVVFDVGEISFKDANINCGTAHIYKPTYCNGQDIFVYLESLNRRIEQLEEKVALLESN